MLRRYDRQLSYCAFCPKLCRCACPVSNVTGRETLIPQQKMQILYLLRHGHLAWERDFADVLYACAACRACHSFCKHPVDVAETLVAGRAEAVLLGADHPRLADFDFTFRRRLPRLREAARAHLPKGLFAREAGVAYYPGCEAILNAPGDVLRTIAVLGRLGAEHVRLFDGDELCAGYPLWASGHHDAFKAHAERVALALGRYARIVCGCPACTFLIRHRYPEIGVRLDAEVLDLSEYLESLVGAVVPVRRVADVFFHDPCTLGRFLGIYDAPRRVLDAVVERRYEFSRSRGDSVCCGGGGLLPRTAPETAAAMAEARLTEVVEAGAHLVATACPTCKRRLGEAAARIEARDGGPRLEILDLVDVIDRATTP